MGDDCIQCDCRPYCRYRAEHNIRDRFVCWWSTDTSDTEQIEINTKLMNEFFGEE